MKPFECVTGVAAPLPLPNIDTDVIMPKQFLKRIDRQELAEGVFHDVRFDDAGAERPEFILNDTQYRNPQFLVTGRNFGCGSSREHAVWGLMQFGIRAIIAPSFAGIFFGNCEKNGLLAITLPQSQVESIIEAISVTNVPAMTVDLKNRRISLGTNDEIPFEIEPERRHNLLEGLDHVAETLRYTDAIKTFQAQHLRKLPWLDW